MKRIFSKGDKYRPIVKVEKTKKEIPTVIMVSGRRYVLDHVDNYKMKKRGGRNKKN